MCGLDELAARLRSTDLVPSRVSLLDALDTKMEKRKRHGIGTVAVLRDEVRNARRIDALAAATGIAAA